MIVIGIIGISLSAIFVKYSAAPSSVTAAYRLLWTVLLMTPVVLGKKRYLAELRQTDRKTVCLCAVSGIFLALHFTFWFESLSHTTVASSTAIVCTEVIWVALGFTIFMKGHLSRTALISIVITLAGSILIAFSDSAGSHGSLYGDMLALAAAVFVAVYTLIGRIARTEMSTVSYTYIVYGFCSISLVFALLVQGNSLFGHGKKPGSRRAFVKYFFHFIRPQHLQLVPEIFLTGLCIGLQAVRTCGGICICSLFISGTSRCPSDPWRTHHDRRRASLLQG